MSPGSPPTLGRSLRRWDLVAVVVNGVIGAGIFGLPSKVFAKTGSYSLLAFAVCAACAMVIVLAFAEVASRYSESGGPYLYAHEAFGGTVGFCVGWLVWITRVTGFAANVNLLPFYLSLLIPGLSHRIASAIFLILIAVSFTALNVAGVGGAARAGRALAVLKLLPLLLLAVGGLLFLNPSHFDFRVAPSYQPFSESVLLLIYAFTGFEMAVIPAGETDDPKKNLPLALGLGMCIVAVLYLTLQASCISLLPGLATSQRPLADAAVQLLGFSGGLVITIGVVVSVLGNLNVQVLAASRMLHAIAGLGFLPRRFHSVNRHTRTPAVAFVFTGAIMLLLSVSGTFIYLLTVSTLARLIGYAVTCLSLIALRRKLDAPPPSFRLRYGTALAIAGVIICLWLVSSSNAVEARDTAIVLVAGIALSSLYRLRRNRS